MTRARMPPFGFCNATNLPRRSPSTILRPAATSWAAWRRRSEQLWSSNKIRWCSAVHPDGPLPAGPHAGCQRMYCISIECPVSGEKAESHPGSGTWLSWGIAQHCECLVGGGLQGGQRRGEFPRCSTATARSARRCASESAEVTDAPERLLRRHTAAWLLGLRLGGLSGLAQQFIPAILIKTTYRSTRLANFCGVTRVWPSQGIATYAAPTRTASIQLPVLATPAQLSSRPARTAWRRVPRICRGGLCNV